MEKEIKSCANITKCIGTISEINLEFYQKEDNVVIKGAIVLLVNNNYIRFNVMTNKKNREQYYKLIETIGIPYHFISCIDNDKYELIDTQPITVGMFGSVKITKNKEVIKKVDFIQSNNSTKLFIISNLTEYGNQATYISLANNNSKCGINTKLQGIVYKFEKDCYTSIIIPNNSDINIIKIKCLQDVTIGKLYDFQLEWKCGYKLIDNIVSNTDKSEFIIIGRKELEYQYDVSALRNMIKIYEIKNSN